MSKVWKTKFGPRRVRHDPPTLDEAIAAAKGLTDDVEAQIDIAASLMTLPREEVRVAFLKAGGPRTTIATMAFTGRAKAPRTVIVERKVSRRPLNNSITR